MFLLSLLYRQQEQVWKRYADSFHITGFIDQMYNAYNFKNLSEILKPYIKAQNSLENRCKQEPSILKTPQYNQHTECAVSYAGTVCCLQKQTQTATPIYSEQ